MKSTIIKILKSLVLLILWVIASPLILFIDKRWRILPKWLRITGAFVSPVMLKLYFFAAICAYITFGDILYRSHFVKPKAIENITGVEMPKYKVLEKNYGKTSFTYDFKDEFVLEFKKMPDSTFYQTLLDNNFEKKGNCYDFHLIWGAGIVAPELSPKGESGNCSFSVKIKENEKIFKITVVEM